MPNSLSVRAKLALTSGVFILSFALYGGWSFKTLSEIKVSGPVYQKIVQSKDLIADILPPPAYIIESYLTALQLATEPVGAEQDKLIDKLTALKKDYDTRHAFWDKEGLDSNIRQALLQQAHEPALAFYDLAFNSLIPAVRNKEAGRIDHSMTRIKSAYDAHREAINHVVELSNAHNASVEAAASKQLRDNTIVLMAILALSLLAGFATTLFAARSILKRTQSVSSLLNEIGRGKFDNQITVGGTDEMGKMLTTLDGVQTYLQGAAARAADHSCQIEAIGKAQGVVEIALDGTLLTANENFLRTLGYTLGEIKGQHQSLFFEPAYSAGADYRTLWEQLARGDFAAAQCKHIGKGGKEIWIQASYTPIIDTHGKPSKIVQYATDVTAQVLAGQALEQAVAQTQKVAGAAREGDLTQRISLADKTGQIEALCASVNALIENMSAVVGQIKESSDLIGTASKEITSGNADLSNRTEKQASSLEQTSSSLDQLTSAVKQNAENAKQANQLAIGASDIAVRGGDVVKQVVTTMSSISDSSRKIVDIISVIDGIAFQTNILALNAAVEAARAGDQGRGFAVVATEVRNLAQRSAAAAKEIKLLIEDSVSKVDNGTKLVDQAGNTMDEIVTSVKRVTDIMSEIDAASQEQSAGIDQVSVAISQMDEATQQNAALVEQAAAAAESMEEQTQKLVDAVAIFRLDEAAQPGVERRSPHRARNVERLPKPAAKAKTSAHASAPKRVIAKVIGSAGSGHTAGSDAGDWEEF